MMEMLPVSERTPDNQYRDRLKQILTEGVEIKNTAQEVPAITLFGTLPPMVFDLRNGAPIITERKIGFWRKPIAELLCFIHGFRTLSMLEALGCGWWSQWATEEKCKKRGLATGDLGPGSYGAAFCNFPMPNGDGFNQFVQVVEEIKNNPHSRTIFVSPWIPYYAMPRGADQKAVVSPCHGWVHLRVMNGRLHLHMFQRSADFPVGVPSNMVQYAALLLMLAQVTGYEPGCFHHSFSDAHIYADQVEAVKEIISRPSRPLPTLALDEDITDLFEFTPDHFTLTDYDPHPAINSIPVAT